MGRSPRLAGQGPGFVKRRGGGAGFTLVELLVVIAVIAILAALLLPGLYRAKVATDAVVCRSNLHQLSIALLSYKDDFKAYPVYRTMTADEHGQIMSGTYWLGNLEPYMNAKVPYAASLWMSNDWPKCVYDCPSFKRLRGHAPNRSYAYNVCGVGPEDTAKSSLGLGGERMVPDNKPAWGIDAYRPNGEGEVLQPSDMIALGDGLLGKNTTQTVPSGYPTIFVDDYLGEFCGDIWSFANHDWQSFFRAAYLRHSGRFNLSFCDGHAEYLRWQAFYAPVPELYKRWNNDHQPHLEMMPRQLP